MDKERNEEEKDTWVKSNVPLMGRTLTVKQDRDNSISDVEESFVSFVQSVCCPTFSFLSVSFFLSCVQVVIYIMMVCYGIELEENKLFAPTISTLEMFGMKELKSIKAGHVWRWITSVCLHSSLIHLVINVISQLIVGSYIEAIFGQWRTFLLFVVSAISGGVFSCLISDINSTSASSIIFAMLAAYIVFTIINFHSLDKQINTTNKYLNLIFIIFIIVLNITSGFTNGRIDIAANFGSFIFSFFFAMIIIAPLEKDQGLFMKDRIYFWIGIAIICVIIPLEILLFFTVRKIS